MSERDSTGAATRRRERRLRVHWRHEQLTLRMVVAAVEHGAPRGQTTATRTKAEECETFSAPRQQEPPLPFTLDDETMLVKHRSRAGGIAGAAAAGAGSAAHRGARRRRLSLRADPRCACAADGGPSGGIHAAARHCDHSAGYRSAQDQTRQNPAAFCGLASRAEC